MVQIYNPNVVGKQILIDVKNIEKDRLKTVEMIKPFMDKVVEELNLKVVEELNLVSTHINLKKIMFLRVLQ